MVVISIVVAPSLCCVTAPLWRCNAGSGSHPPHLISGNTVVPGNDLHGREADIRGLGTTSDQHKAEHPGSFRRLRVLSRSARTEYARKLLISRLNATVFALSRQLRGIHCLFPVSRESYRRRFRRRLPAPPLFGSH